MEYAVFQSEISPLQWLKPLFIHHHPRLLPNTHSFWGGVRGDRWPLPRTPHPHAPRALPHLENCHRCSAPAHAGADHRGVAHPTPVGASCQPATAAETDMYPRLCVDVNEAAFDLCGGTRTAVTPARLALLLAVCSTSVIPKQPLSVRCLLIHSPRGVQAQVAALTVNVFPKIPATASHLHPCTNAVPSAV